MTVFSCGPGEAPPPPPAPVSTEGATAGYTLESLPRTDLMKAFKYDPEGQVLEMGYFLDDRPEGTWYYYEHPTKEFPKRIVSYHAGILNGPYMELTENGTVSLQAYYENNELNGHWGTYKFGRPIKTADYENGILEGFYREYTTTAGKLQKEIHYKNGKEDGPYRFYNDRGEITLEYTYKNGEKVGGGVIESDRPNVPR
ncbi:hypothetical protein CRP01_21635 [Flavilitoribacter nigricans DSM 23189 = NBRC 102662]|uniref:Toxin-antitoxin system YwqK family antitoxin n=2 Tax=Flavilitoribacter TaxID=2762562 RepID=A0A2D0N884_FLAN2|nr:hypothetical protein CRP01_21635 [Flavilitoribacter nigricans DSM 23189 = NBRC 102662]